MKFPGIDCIIISKSYSVPAILFCHHCLLLFLIVQKYVRTWLIEIKQSDWSFTVL